MVKFGRMEQNTCLKIEVLLNCYVSSPNYSHWLCWQRGRITSVMIGLCQFVSVTIYVKIVTVWKTSNHSAWPVLQISQRRWFISYDFIISSDDVSGLHVSLTRVLLPAISVRKPSVARALSGSIQRAWDPVILQFSYRLYIYIYICIYI